MKENKVLTAQEPVKHIFGPDGCDMYFVGFREVVKPKLLDKPIGDIVAFSDTGLGGKRHLFNAGQVANIENMEVSACPDWI